MLEEKATDQFSGRLEIFIHATESKFDQQMMGAAADIIKQAVERLDRPTTKNLAEDLGIMRARVSRIIEAVGLEEWYKACKEERLGQLERGD